jgi:vancomycin resistance protein YoaR
MRSRVWLLRVAIVLVAAAALLVALLVGFRIARAGTVLPGVEVAGLPVGGMTEAQLHDTLTSRGEQRADAPVQGTRPAPEGHDPADEATVTVTGGELGYHLDVDATSAAVMHRGRQGNPVVALADHFRSLGGVILVDASERLDGTAVRDWVAEAADQLSLEPVEGDLLFDGTTITRVDPAPGVRVLTEPLEQDLIEAILLGGADQLVAQTEPVDPLTTTADVDAIYADAERALSGPVTLHRNDGSVTFEPADIAAVLRVDSDTSGDSATLRLAADHEAVAAHIPPAQIDGFEADAVDARFEVGGGGVQIIESRDGFRFDAPAAAAQLVAVATGDGPRDAELDGEILQPDLTTDAARDLGITEQVSTFTTHYQAGQSRVTNIHRIADLVDGVVVRPGDTFSLNGHVGPRTRDKGFVEGGAIFEGEFISAVGGGVSQFATTFFNAAFFGGYEFLQYKAHSYYISRYPVGREATIDYPSVDLAIRNNSPHGLLIKTGYTASSITVTFYATTWVDVESLTGEQHNFRQPQTQVRENPALPAGSERVVQSGRQGFDIVVTRVLRFPDGREEREQFFTRYLAEPRIVERGSGAPPPDEEPAPPDNGEANDQDQPANGQGGDPPSQDG